MKCVYRIELYLRSRVPHIAVPFVYRDTIRMYHVLIFLIATYLKNVVGISIMKIYHTTAIYLQNVQGLRVKLKKSIYLIGKGN